MYCRRSIIVATIYFLFPSVHGGGGLELVKLARNQASSRSKPCTSLKSAPGVLPICCCLFTLVRRKQAVVREQLSPQEPPGRAMDSRVQGFSTPLARRRSRHPSLSPTLTLTRPLDHVTVRVVRVLLRPTRLSTIIDSASCISRATSFRRSRTWN